MTTDSAGTHAWEKRFRLPHFTLPDCAQQAPNRSLFVSNATGKFELYAWDRDTGEQRQVTDRPTGTMDGFMSPDGRWIWWFEDTDGDEFGVWVRQPFEGGPSTVAVPGLEPACPAGIALSGDCSVVVVGRSARNDGSTIHVAPAGRAPVEIYRHQETARVGGLSHDGNLIALEHTEHADALHPALRIVRLDGSPVAELDDSEGGARGLGLDVWGFAPVPGDTRLLVGHQRRGRWEPLVWDVASTDQLDPDLKLPGDVSAEWYPDGSGLLVEHHFEARSELFRYDLERLSLTRLPTPPGTVSAATARPDGTVEYLWSSAATPPEVRSTGGKAVFDAPGTKAPGSVPVEDAWVEGAGGRVHALVQRPAGAGPFPTVFDIHGGPMLHDRDEFAAGPAAWLDHGYAVVRVNYRGSTGYGRDWSDALKHRIGLIELEDIAAVREWAVSSGLSDPARLILTGGSWGGYLTLLGIGVQPDDWAVGIAAAPIADYVTAYHDETEGLKAIDRALFGGAPQEVPERFAASSPLTYADRVKVPVRITAGVNDPRCPVRQIENYVERLEVSGVTHEAYWFDAGHGSLVVEERIKQMRLDIEFAQRHLG
ncbi:S9 family peptidase [Streptomyces rubiginosohelvolus]|uniref:S9 family peptidase n=1 Tax=Streptomyces rubiginosohelvolus TaxID=67362 RepID=UPI0036ABA91F